MKNTNRPALEAERTESFEARQARGHEQQAIGDALAQATWERGGRLTDDEIGALRHWSMWGSDGYPVQRLGRKWTIDHIAAKGAGLYATKREAINAWEILIAKWVRLSGLAAQARAIAAAARLGVI